jgi:hypothetical protein
LQELADIKASGLKSFRDIDVDERNLLIWSGLIVPENPPYNKGAFRIEITFPAEYPFKVSLVNHGFLELSTNLFFPLLASQNMLQNKDLSSKY